MSRAERRKRQLELGIELALLGARGPTIKRLTGLARGDLMSLPRRKTMGRRPNSDKWWYSNCSAVQWIHASCLVSIYAGLRDSGIEPEWALVAAYKVYQDRFPESASGHTHDTNSRINFERAIDLVSLTDGRWGKTPLFALFSCLRCSGRYLTPGAIKSSKGRKDCPFCFVAVRYHEDERYRLAFPERKVSKRALSSARFDATIGAAPSGAV